ncbi:hypothetical protein HYU12_00810 [Candidatus Woesearchaeota archaeon]|nr:hypothetical protein [Candidatus Woesearchaeota archaeon]
MVISIDNVVETVAPRFSYLTERRREVLCYVAEGFTASEAGEKMFIGSRSVETHKRDICNLLGINGQYNLVLTALFYAAVSGRKVDFPEISVLKLTRRQRELFESVGRGDDYREAAVEADISPNTVPRIFGGYIKQKILSERRDGANKGLKHSYLVACAAWNVVVKPYVESHPEAFNKFFIS